MKDPHDKATPDLIDKPRRGRPPTGKAMTPAEKQRAYRERQKAKSGSGYVDPATVEEIKRMQAEITRLRALIATEANKGNVTKKADSVFVLQAKKGNSWKDSEICYYSTMQKAQNALKSLGEEGKNKEMWRIRQRQFV